MAGIGRVGFIPLALIVLVAGCAAPQATAPTAGGEASTTQSRTMVMVVRNEPLQLSPKDLLVTPGITTNSTTRLFNAALALNDERGVARPYLAEALPQLNSDSWRVFPDGRMETRYGLRPSLTWQDGRPLTAEDFVFAWQVYTTPALGVATSLPQGLMEEVRAPDPRTLVVHWRRSFPGADALADTFTPLPRHLLEAPFQELAAEPFSQLPFWTRDYVGAGPYRVVDWQPGAFLEGVAFDGHVLGRPKIERVIVRFIPDNNTALANLLAGEIHLAVDFAITFQQAAVLQREWGPTNAGKVLLNPKDLRYSHVQFRPELAKPRELLDVRARRALLHSLDRQSLADAIAEGQGVVAHTLLPPLVEYFPAVDNVVTKYPYDLRRAEDLLREVGYTRGPEGTFVSGQGRFTMEVWSTASPQNQVEVAIMEEAWRRFGLEASPFAIPVAQTSDGELRASFPTVQNNTSPQYESTLRNVQAATIPTRENRWTGNNRGGWSNPEYERLVDAFTTELDIGQRGARLAEAMKLVSEELPLLPLRYDYFVVAHAAALQGPQLTAPITLVPWNINQWELR